MKQCYICKGDIKPKFTLKNFTLYNCSRCNHQVFLPYPKNLKKIYQKPEYYTDGQKFPLAFRGKKTYQNFPQLKTFVKRLSAINSFSHFQNPRILDVGCGNGLFVYLCNQQKNKAIGIDFSKTAIQLTRRLQCNCYHQDFLKDISSSSFDIITMFDVLEHLTNPRDYLKKACRVLGKKSLLILSTPRANGLSCKIFGKRWHLYTPPLHIHIFSRQSIQLLLKEQGFKILKIKNQGQSSNLGYMLSKLLSIYKLKTTFTEKLLVKSRLYHHNIYCNLFDVMTVFAQKDT